MPAKRKSLKTGEITELLHKDHQIVSELFFQFSDTEDADEKEALVKQILSELYLHAKAEEEIVYPVVKLDSEQGSAFADEAQTEHRMFKYLMAELSQMEAGAEQFEAKVTTLSELVNHHVREEEKTMFKMLHESGADLEGLAEQVQKLKDELKSRPLPPMEASLAVGDSENIARPRNMKSRKQGRAS